MLPGVLLNILSSLLFVKIGITFAMVNAPFATIVNPSSTSSTIPPSLPPWFLTTVSNSVVEEILQLSNTLVQLYQENATLRTLISNITGICPEWVPCDVDILQAIEPGNECCLKCFCDDNCNARRPCCPGFQPNVTKRDLTELFNEIPKVCVESAYFSSKNSITSKTIDFEMITDCPTGTPVAIKENCTAMFNNLDEDYIYSFLDIIPVSDSLTETNFANRHCAACNGLPNDRYVRWSIQVSCDKELVFDSETFEAVVQQRDDCFLKIIPPSSEIGNATLCFSDMTSLCNETGVWKSYDVKTEQLCTEVDWLFVTPKASFRPHKRYKNIFCAICNGENYAEDSICPEDEFDEVNFGYQVFLNFNAEFQESTSDIQVYDVRRCPLGFMADPLSRSCKEVVCSFPRVLNKLTMTCEDRFESMTFGSVEIPYRFVLDPAQPIIIRGLSQFHAYLTEALDPLREGISCNFHSIFYKADILYDSLEDQYFINGDVEVISGIIIAYADLRRPFTRSFQSVVQQYLTLNLTVANRLIDLEYGGTETAYLPTAWNASFPETKTKLLGETGLPRKRSTEIVSLYRDPFDGKAVIRFGRNFDVSPCVSGNLLYKKSYYACSAFEYDINIYKINYTSNGIVLPKEEIGLGFGEFRMLNESHVAICLENLEENGLAVENSLYVSGCTRHTGLFRITSATAFVYLIMNILSLLYN